MIEDGMIDQFLANWQTINRHLRKGTLREGNREITRLQWMFLRHARREEACTIGHLAEKFGVRPSTISQMADRLEIAGLIRRVSNVSDARVRIVSLTEKGRELIHSVESVWAKRLTEGLSQFSDNEQKDLLKLLERLASSLAEPSL